MSNKKLLIASSSRNEAITKWIRESNLLDSIVDLIFVSELLNEYDIRDELNDNHAVISWYESNGLKYSNETHCLLNRVIYLEDELFHPFQLEDREYAKREFEAYLGFALNSFQSPQNSSVKGICERIYSLPQQWHFVDKFLNINIPEYYRGSKYINPFENEPNIVHSNIYNFLNWTIELGELENKTGFCFKKPEGRPLFVLSIGDSFLITKDYELNYEQMEQVENILQRLKTLFGYFIFELLIFVTDKKMTFGCINIDVIRSPKNPLFNDFLRRNLIKEYYKCLN